MCVEFGVKGITIYTLTKGATSVKNFAGSIHVLCFYRAEEGNNKG